MGGTCNSQPQPTFTESLKYHSTEMDKISTRMTRIYSYKQIFIQQKEYNIATKQELQQQIKKLSICIKCPIGVQSILKYQTTRVLLPCPCSNINVCSGMQNHYGRGCSNNYRVVVYAEHLCFSFREHLQGLRWKGLWLSQKEVFYVVREIVTAAKFIWSAGYKVTSFDPNSLYLSTTYQLKIPFQHITPQSTPSPPSAYPSPQQLQQIKKSNQISTDKQTSLYLYSSEQSSIFSVGMLLLECITMLDSIVYYYNLHRKFIYVDRYQKQISNVSNQVLRGMLSGMLEVEPGKRVTWRELGRILDGLGQDMFENYLIID